MRSHKKVLIISYFWPPSGGPGVQRVLKFCKYLPEFGWEPVVLTVATGDYPNFDYSLLEEIPEQQKVYKTKTVEPYNIFRIITGRSKDSQIPTHVLGVKKKTSLSERLSFWIRANFFIPDARIGWLPYGIKKGKEIIRRENINLIFSSGPPHTVHLMAKSLAKKFKLPMVTDFRDPWVDIIYYDDLKRSRLTKKIDQYLEKSVLKSAKAVISVSPTMNNSLFRPKVNNNYYVIANGFDHQDLADLKFETSKKFRISYIGHLWKHHRPGIFFKTVSKLLERDKDFSLKLSLVFVGSLHEDAKEMIRKLKLADYVKHIEYLPHQEAFQSMINSEVLYLPIFYGALYQLSGKLFEYIASRSFILGIGPTNGDAARIIEETKTGVMLDYEDFESIQKTIMGQFQIWKKHPSKRFGDNDAVNKYERKNLTESLSDIFRTACES